MKNEIIKNLFTYSPSSFKEIFDKYVTNRDYNKEIKSLQNSDYLLDEIISKRSGLIFYLDKNYENFFYNSKLPFFNKLLKYIIASETENENNSNKDKENNKQTKNKKKIEINEKNKYQYYLFNPKINAINDCRKIYYYSNIMQSLSPLSYFSLILIYLKNIPLSLFFLSVYFYTFISYLCEDDSKEFIHSLLFSILISIGFIILITIHYIKENIINLIFSKSNDFKNCCVYRTFVNEEINIKEKIESKKSANIQKYYKIGLKSFLNRINKELYNYEYFKCQNKFNYIPENYISCDSFSLFSNNVNDLIKKKEIFNTENENLDHNNTIYKINTDINEITKEEENIFINEIQENKIYELEDIKNEEENSTKNELIKFNSIDQSFFIDKNDIENKLDVEEIFNENNVDPCNSSDKNEKNVTIVTNENKDESFKSENIKKNKDNLLNYIFFTNNIYNISDKNILTGDIIYLFKGDIIPADGILLKGSKLIVNESHIMKSENNKKSKKISLDEYIYNVANKKTKQIYVYELKKKKKKNINYFKKLNLKIKMKFNELNEKRNNLKNKKKEIKNNTEEKNISIYKNETELKHENYPNEINYKKSIDIHIKNDMINTNVTENKIIIQDKENVKEFERNISFHVKKINEKKNFNKKENISPLLLSNSIVCGGNGLMVATCVSKNKQLYFNCVKNNEDDNTQLEDIINNYTKNVVIVIVFCCCLCMFFIIIHLLFKVIQNNLKTSPYNLIKIILSSFILQIFIFFLLSIDQLPLLLQNCLVVKGRKILYDDYIIKNKKTFENTLFTNTIFIDLERYLKYKCICFFYNDLFYSINNESLNYIKLDLLEHVNILNEYHFNLLIQNILLTSNLYQYNEHFLQLDLGLLKFIKYFDNFFHTISINKNILSIISNNKNFVCSFLFLNDSLLKQWKSLEINKIHLEQINDISNINILRIYVKGYVNDILPYCVNYIYKDNIENNINKLKEEINKIPKDNYTILCFAYKDIIIKNEDIEKYNFLKDINNYFDEKNEIENENINIDNLTCVSILIFEKVISKTFLKDYKLLEESNLNVKIFTKENLDASNKLFNNIKFYYTLKHYDSKKIRGYFDSDEFKKYYDYNLYWNSYENNQTDENKNEIDENLKRRYSTNLSHSFDMDNDDINFELCRNNFYNKLRDHIDEINYQKCRSIFMDIKKFNYIIKKNEEKKMKNLIIIKKIYNTILENNYFYNCSSKDILSISAITKLYDNIILVTNKPYVIFDKSNITICDYRSKYITKNKCDIILLNKSLQNYIKIKNMIICIFNNIKLYIEYNITFYTIFLLFAILSTLVNGIVFLSTMQILYIYIFKNIIIHYLTCYRKSIYVNENITNQNLFSKKKINNIISNILSKFIILFLLYLFGHLFIPEVLWTFVTPENRISLHFSEFSFSDNNQIIKQTYGTIRSTIKFKQTLQDLIIEKKIKIQKDYKTLAEWDQLLSPNRHDTIIFNVFFLLFFFYFIKIYLNIILKEIKHFLNNKKYNEYLLIILNKKIHKNFSEIFKIFNNMLSNNTNNNIKFNNKKNINLNNNVKNININEQSSRSISEENILININNNLKDNENINKKILFKLKIFMLFKSLIKNYITFLVLFILFIIHICIIQFGSFLFNCNKNGLTFIQWLISFLLCLIDYCLSLLFSHMNIFNYSFNFLHSSYISYKPQESNVYDTINHLKKNSLYQRFKYKNVRKSWN